MPSTNFALAARIRETSAGVTPASPVMEYIFATGLQLTPDDRFSQSQTITGKRGIAEYLRTGVSVSGNVPFELSGGWADWIIENALFDDFGALVEAYNLTADSAITNVALSSQTLLAAGAWVPGMLVETTGFAVAGNNKKFRAQAGSGAGTLIAPAGTFTADEAAPPIGARALAYGIEGAAGDLVTAADGITSTALDFTTFGILVGAQVIIQGTGAAAVDGALATISAVAANKLTLEDLPAGFTAGVGAGVSMQILVGEFATPGETLYTDTIKLWNTRTSPIAYQNFRGVATNGFSLNLTLNEIVTGSATLIGFAGSVTEALGGATFIQPRPGVTNQPMKTGAGPAGVSRLLEGGVAVATQACCQSLSLTFANNLRPVGCLTEDAAVDFDLGDSTLQLEQTWRFRDKALLDKFHAGTATQHLFMVRRGRWGYAFKAPFGHYTAINAGAGGRNSEHTVNTTFQAEAHPVTGRVFTVSRFRVLS